jgi:hypothetical protein
MAFNTTHINLGRIRANKRYEVKFPYDDTVKDIGFMSTSCGCSGAQHLPVSKEVIINYHPGSVPQHLLGQGFYTSRNHANVDIINGDGSTSTIILSFEAIVTN